ncbi:MAG: MOSC domain-containing protein [Phycisphaerales bacterium]|nr:MOSC domain-containing protein [Phycisphaerales bacterium]
MSTSPHTSQSATNAIQVASLHVYPLKGAAGFSPHSCPVDERGLRHDRRFMLVDETGNFISQRTCAKLALVRADIANTTLRLYCPARAAPHSPRTEAAIVHADLRVCEIALDTLAANTPQNESEYARVQVWNDFVQALAIWPEVDAALSEFLGQACRLVWMPDSATRLTNINRGEPRRNVSFADAAPLLLTSETSLQELNARLQAGGSAAIPMDRFRANIVIRGAALAEDDHWSALTINKAKFRASNSCKRCKVITIDQTTGEFQSRDPVITLATYRSDGNSVTFGQHLLVERSGMLSVGDRVVVDASHR